MNRGRMLAAAVLCGVGMSSWLAGVARAAEPDVPADKSWAFTFNDQGFKPGSEIDLRSLNENVAGEHGFIALSADKEGFVRGDGQPIRFWAINPKLDTPMPELQTEARFLAKQGVNMARVFVGINVKAKEGSQIDAIDPESIDRIWRCVAAFKKEGIYSTICPYWATTSVPESWGLPGGAAKNAFGLIFFNPKLQDAYKTWVKALYLPKNPYTGIPLSQDPAVAVIQVQNEDGMFFWTIQGIDEGQQELLGEVFAKWLTKKYGSVDKGTARWAGDKEKGDDFAAGKIGIMPMFKLIQNHTGGNAARSADQIEFFADTQRDFYSNMIDFYRHTLGCKQLINCSNWQTANSILLNDDERYTYEVGQVMAVNHYYSPAHIGVNKMQGWRIDPGDTYADPTATIDIRNLPCNFKQVVGFPFMVTESSWVNPMSHQSEGPLLMAAYQSLTGMNAYFWFAGMSPEYDTDPYFNFINIHGSHAEYKWTCTKPEIMGMFPAAALIYRKGYIEAGATPAIHEERSLADMWDEKPPLIAEDASFDPTRYAGKTGSEEMNIKGGINPLAYLVGRVEVKYGGVPSHSTAVDFSKYIDPERKIIHSITGQITMDYGIGLCTVNAPRAVEAIGALDKGGKMKLGDVTLESGNDYASVAVVPLDGAPIAASGKLLVQVGTWGRPTGWSTTPWKLKNGAEGFRISATGHMPERLINTDVTISVKNSHLTKAVLLDTAGYPAKTLEGKTAGGVFTLTLPADAMYVVLE